MDWNGPFVGPYLRRHRDQVAEVDPLTDCLDGEDPVEILYIDSCERISRAAKALETLARVTSSPAGIDTSTTMGGWLSSLFGHNLSEVTDKVAEYAGIRKSSAASLLSVGAPLVLGYIGRLMHSENLTVTGLTDLFRNSRTQLAAAVPSGFVKPVAPYDPRKTIVEV